MAASRAVGYPPPPVFSQVFILKVVKVLCFDTLLQVFILKVVMARARGRRAYGSKDPPLQLILAVLSVSAPGCAEETLRWVAGVGMKCN